VSPDVKICGISDDKALQAAIECGASYVGFVFYPPSPRALDTKIAAQLAVKVPVHIMSVGLLVDPSDDDILNVVRNVVPSMVMKAIGIATEKDFVAVKDYEAVADMLLFDAKPSKNAALPGGNAESFDWSLLKGRSFAKPWLLAGGINAHNLAEAVKESGARGVYVSSGVEDRPGHKNPDKIREFLKIAESL
jgi:phosphoribosylanthranilate isomerase